MQAQALFCLTTHSGSVRPRSANRRACTPKQRATCSQAISADYQRSRAGYYVGLAAWAEAAVPEAIAEWELAVQEARRVGNLQLEPLVLMNLGVAEERRGRRARAEDYYRDSYMAYEVLGDNARAAQIQANRGALLIEYGDDPDEGRRDIENALAVARKLGDRTFEMFCLQWSACTTATRTTCRRRAGLQSGHRYFSRA
jgi:tetratricopeptide (TPR) repeat protein